MGNGSSKDIHELIEIGNVDDVEKFLEKNPTVINEFNDSGETPLFRACSNGNPEIAELLVEFGADIKATCQSCLNMTSLHMASTDDMPDLVDMLISNGADPDARSVDNATPLHVAFQYGSFEVAQVLIKAGADTTARTDEGQTPFEVEILDPAEMKPFTFAQIQSLRALAAATPPRSKTSVAARDQLPICKEDLVDVDTMLVFFREAGLGHSEALVCARECVRQKAKTAKKLALMVFNGRYLRTATHYYCNKPVLIHTYALLS